MKIADVTRARHRPGRSRIRGPGSTQPATSRSFRGCSRRSAAVGMVRVAEYQPGPAGWKSTPRRTPRPRACRHPRLPRYRPPALAELGEPADGGGGPVLHAHRLAQRRGVGAPRWDAVNLETGEIVLASTKTGRERAHRRRRRRYDIDCRASRASTGTPFVFAGRTYGADGFLQASWRLRSSGAYARAPAIEDCPAA